MRDSTLEITGSYEDLSEATASMIAGHPKAYAGLLADNMDTLLTKSNKEITDFEADLKKTKMGKFILGLLGGDLVGKDGEATVTFKGDKDFLRALESRAGAQGSGAAPTGGGAPAPPTSAGGGYASRATGGAPGPISSAYGMRRHPITGAYSMHTGVDYGSLGRGKPLYSPFAGKVVGAYSHSGWGNVVTIQGPNGIGVGYAHLDTFPSVRAGQTVGRGQFVGRVGGTGSWSTGPHLHMEVLKAPYRMYSDAINPYPYLKNGAVVKSPTTVNVGEHGPEAVIPLDERGVSVLGEAIGRHIDTWDARNARVAPYATSTTHYSTHVYDSSTRVTGPVSVVSNDPVDMGRKIQRRTRSAKAYAPAVRGGR